MRALLSLALKESKQAAGTPFPFARLAEELPKICGATEFLLLAVDRGNTLSALHALLDLAEADVAEWERMVREVVSEKFMEINPYMCRQCSIALGGKGVDAEALLERYLVEGLDRNYQRLIGKVLFRSIQTENSDCSASSARTSSSSL